MRSLSIVLLFACSQPDSSGFTDAPLAGNDAADHDCRVILRGVDGPLVDFDVRTQLSAPGSLLYRADGGAWTAAAGLAISGAPGWYSRFRVRLPDEAKKVELIPYAAVDGGRLFDHNRIAGDYVVHTPFTLADDGRCLDRAQPKAQLEFHAGFTTTQRGQLARGGHLSIHYDLSRLTSCRSTHNGSRFWSLDAFVKFQPSGFVSTGTVVASNAGSDFAVPFEADIPDGTQSAELWFHNYTPGECDAWDSNFGANYHFAVGAPTAAIGWFGDFGSSFSRDCQHQNGVPDPAVIDEYVRERACSFVDADVYVPGGEDHPEWIWAEVVWQKDALPPVTGFLDVVGRVGNNSRFRWSLPYELRNLSDWTQASYHFRFSSDGNSFQDGPSRQLTSEASR